MTFNQRVIIVRCDHELKSGMQELA